VGEAVGLRVRDPDMLRRRANVEENAVQSGTQIYVGTPNIHKLRDVPLPAFLLLYLARQCEGKDRDDPLFCGGDGGHLKRSAGTNVKAVQKMLGHASAAMTLDVYSDLFDDDLDAVATALDVAREKSAQNVLTHGHPVVQLTEPIGHVPRRA
jgi:integrase